jgi:hypothetical protein
MRVLTIDETVAWLATRQLVLRPAREWGQDHRLAMPEHAHRIWFGTPPEAKRQMSLAHLLSGWLNCTSSLLAINVVAIYQPYELEALLFLRRSAGDERWVDGIPGGGTPGHLFDDDPFENRRRVREFLTVMLAYTFEGYLVQDDGQDVIWIADEVVDVYSANLGRIRSVNEIVDTLGLHMIGAESPVAH